MPEAPPYQITPAILDLVAKVSEQIGRLETLQSTTLTPSLRRANRLRTIQASLQIENNTLDLNQVTAVIEGRKILGNAQDIHEVKNAFAAYEAMERWRPSDLDDLLCAHGLLMSGLTDHAGRFRTRGVGIAKGDEVIHMAPDATMVNGLMKDLLSWLAATESHPLIASCVFHYELEFIHPFSDGNGRMGRLWQTLILSKWKSLFAFLPVETVICQRQDEYYAALGRSDKAGHSTEFVTFILEAIANTLDLAASGNETSDQVGDQVSDQVKTLLDALGRDTLTAVEIMVKLGLRHRATFRKNYLNPALAAQLIERTVPDKPRSRSQKYRKRRPLK